MPGHPRRLPFSWGVIILGSAGVGGLRDRRAALRESLLRRRIGRPREIQNQRGNEGGRRWLRFRLWRRLRVRSCGLGDLGIGLLQVPALAMLRAIAAIIPVTSPGPLGIRLGDTIVGHEQSLAAYDPRPAPQRRRTGARPAVRRYDCL